MTPPRQPRIFRSKYEKPPGCQDCPAARFSKGYVPADGPPTAPILFLGESPWIDELSAGFPFAGAAGMMLERILRRNSWTRAAYRFENVLRCAVGTELDQKTKQKWLPAAAAHCRQYTDVTLAEPHQVIVPLGGLAIRRAFNLWGKGVRVEDFHGTVSQLDDGRWVVPTYHPSHLQRGAHNLLGVVSFDLQRAHQVAEGAWQADLITPIVDPPAAWFRAWADQYLAAVAADPEHTWLAVDIETPEKAGKDEASLGPLTPEQLADRLATSRSYTLTRLNFACHPDEGVTVPAVEPYLTIAKDVLASAGTKVGWFFDYDHPRLEAAGLKVHGTIYDLPWLCHLLQSDLPLGLGFWAPFYSRDARPWKHLAETDEGFYAALDGAQTLRIAFGAVEDAVTQGLWPTFLRHVHRLREAALIPAHTVGVLVNRPELDRFEADLTAKASALQTEIQQIVPDELRPLTPKAGLKNRPVSALHTHARTEQARGGAEKKHKPDPLKQELFRHAEVLEKIVIQEVYVCHTCGAADVGRTHRCRDEANVVRRHGPKSDLSFEAASVRRWFWKEPFNPASPAQLLAYIKAQGHTPGRSKNVEESTDRETLHRLSASTRDPLYGLALKLRAVTKVRSTYVLGVKKRLDRNDRFHPVPTFRPSTGRLSYVSPNIQNVVGERAEKANTLAAGFRRAIVAAAGCRLIEIDFSGIEGCTTAWYCQSAEQLRIAKLGEHAALASHILGRPYNPAWADADIAAYFAEIKAHDFLTYDRAKRTNHGYHYGLTPMGMVRQFPETYPTLRIAEQYTRMLETMCPNLPAWQRAVRRFADEHGYIGGLPGMPPFGHPWARRHWFWAIFAYKRMTEAAAMRAQALAARLRREPPIATINGIPYKIDLGEDSKRCVAMLPQSTAGDILYATMLRLFDEAAAVVEGGYTSYIGDAFQGDTPLRAPIHDSLLLEVPDPEGDRVLEALATEMRRPVVEMPLPEAWGMGSALTIGVEAKVSPVGGSWAEVEKVKLPTTEVEGVAADRIYAIAEEDAEDVADLDVMVQEAQAGERQAGGPAGLRLVQ